MWVQINIVFTLLTIKYYCDILYNKGGEQMDQQYFLRYKELYNLLSRAYFDKCVLNAASSYNNDIRNTNKALPYNSNKVFQHYCDIAKIDLALILWCITDSSGKSNTLITLKNYLYKEYKIKIKRRFSKKSTELINNALSKIRSKALAHNDISKNCDPINMHDLFDLLDESRRLFNEMCYTKEDQRIIPLTDETILKLSLTARTGIGTLINNSITVISGD